MRARGRLLSAAAAALLSAAAVAGDLTGPVTYGLTNGFAPPNNNRLNVVTAQITPAGGSGSGVPQNIQTDAGVNITTDAGVQITTD